MAIPAMLGAMIISMIVHAVKKISRILRILSITVGSIRSIVSIESTVVIISYLDFWSSMIVFKFREIPEFILVKA